MIDSKMAQKLGPLVTRLMRTDAATTRSWAEALPQGALREQVRFQAASQHRSGGRSEAGGSSV